MKINKKKLFTFLNYEELHIFRLWFLFENTTDYMNKNFNLNKFLYIEMTRIEFISKFHQKLRLKNKIRRKVRFQIISICYQHV